MANSKTTQPSHKKNSSINGGNLTVPPNSSNSNVPSSAASSSTSITSSQTSSLKWIKSIRALPSNPSSNDYLKTDYIDVNLNNSRKLISNINELTKSSNESILKMNEIDQSLNKLNEVHHQLNWLNEI